MKITDQIKQQIFEAVKAAYAEVEIKLEDIVLEHPTVEEFGDYSTNIAMKLKVDPKKIVEKVPGATVANGFINFRLPMEFLIGEMKKIDEDYGKNNLLAGKKIMVEFAHPNTHKELHIGHMRTLTTGEALARIFSVSGAAVFRANYQGDIGPHVAKAIWGATRLLKEQNKTFEEAEKFSLLEKAHLLGLGYIEGNKFYEEKKEEIDSLNRKLYQHDPEIWPIYEQTRKWSLDYYDSFYNRFYTKFDKLYFESQVAEPGKKIVLDNVGKIFTESDGAVTFDGEKYGLHKRVFITSDGNPTYEAKDMALAPAQFADFPFDKCVHVVANEQADYFKVIIKALELLNPKFVGREFHLSMGMVNLVGKKISSRTGDIITVDGLIDDVKGLLTKNENEETAEAVTIGAIKYSILKTDPTQNATFDLEKSVSLEGDSGPYLQYTYARAKSVLRKAGTLNSKFKIPDSITPGELSLLRYLYRFPETVELAAKNYAPNLMCTYLFELAKRFNNFYNNVPILVGKMNDVYQENINKFWLKVNENNFKKSDLELPIGKMSDGNEVWLRAVTFAKIRGWREKEGFTGHEEITSDLFRLFPSILNSPTHLIEIPAHPDRLLFVADIGKLLSLVVEIGTDGGRSWLITAFLTKRRYLEKREKDCLRHQKKVSLRGLPKPPILAPAGWRGGGSRFSTLQDTKGFYNKMDSTCQDFRLALTSAVAQILYNGLTLLGIKALERM